MCGVNEVTLIGNVGQAPDVRALPSGDPLASFSLATSEAWKDRQTGEAKERTEWHRVIVLGPLAEVVRQYVGKGARLYLKGTLRTRKWQDGAGQDHYTTEVVIAGRGGSLLMLDSKSGNGAPPTGRAPTIPQQKAGLNRAILDASLGELRRQIAYKAEWNGCVLVVVDRWAPLSKTCSHCGYVLEDLPLSVRAWTCPTCGTAHDRDVNAARNLLVWATGGGPGTRNDACGAVTIPEALAAGVVGAEGRL